MVFQKSQAYAHYVVNVVNAAVMLAFVFEVQLFEHVHHSCDFPFHLHQLRVIGFQVDVLLEIFLHLQVLGFCLESQTSAEVPISAGHEHKVVVLEVGEGSDPFVETEEHFFQSFLVADLFLGDSGEFGAEGRQLRVQGGSNIAMKTVQLLTCMGIDDCDWHFYNFGARLDLLFFKAGGFEVYDQQIWDLWWYVFRREVESHSIDFCFGKGRLILLVQFYADVADVVDVVDAAVMLAFVRYSQSFEHGHHALRPLISDYFGVVFFYVDVISEIVFYVKTLMLALLPQTSSEVPVSAGHNSEVVLFEIWQTREPFVQLLEDFFEDEALVDLLLGDSSEFCAELGQLGVEGWFDIVMEDIYLFP